ncbi:TetR/AcrR family transcriptional regulator [Micromonospora sp. CPCC 205546]|uniref:TetR/AcrR family transcriptional regulator n=1 Tax=Micromonospora sp. CPCC 205546 TaxID=3122397 RepID=UPI002FF07623
MPKIQAPTVAEHRARQRRAILAAAREILAESGAQAPSLAEVGKRTGLARPSVYQYFKSREDLLNAVIADMFPQWSAYVTQQMDRATGPGGRVLAYVEANLHLVAQGEHAVMRGLAGSVSGAVLAEESRVLHDRLRTPLVAALAEHGASDPAAAAELVQAVVYASSQMIENGTPEAAVLALTRELLGPYLRQQG